MSHLATITEKGRAENIVIETAWLASERSTSIIEGRDHGVASGAGWERLNWYRVYQGLSLITLPRYIVKHTHHAVALPDDPQ